jgi:hypothetical protein
MHVFASCCNSLHLSKPIGWTLLETAIHQYSHLCSSFIDLSAVWANIAILVLRVRLSTCMHKTTQKTWNKRDNSYQTIHWEIYGTILHCIVRWKWSYACQTTSDHELLMWSLVTSNRPRRQVQSYRFCNFKKIDLERLKDDIRCSELFQAPACPAEEFAVQL